ncbi:hypothetical protein [Leucothrix arctica]|uniref:DUF2383 domain-containing protein n=1 Tax=Leucothrix arctica TaxID=1481894 RepID=A0A317C980_9GAMM|nr:hypothetical protein [Leucothrix arctica]PWQ95255.1 hypothetical protein DKT75_12995 [Leucothrix arctica]
MKTFETIKDIFDNTEKFHSYAADFYDKLDEESSNPRTKMLLSYVKKHHKAAVKELKKFTEHTSDAVLKTWVQVTLEKSPEDFFSHLSFHKDMNHEEVGALGQQVDGYLVDVYDEMKDVASTDELRGIFQNLMEMEVTRKRRLSQAVNSLLREM